MSIYNEGRGGYLLTLGADFEMIMMRVHSSKTEAIAPSVANVFFCFVCFAVFIKEGNWAQVKQAERWLHQSIQFV